MTKRYHILIIDGYSQKSRDDLETAGMCLAWGLYVKLLKRYLPEATYDILLPTDPDVKMPSPADLAAYGGIIWTGCNLTIYDYDNPSVTSQIKLAEDAYEVGIPSFGSCWGIQMAAAAAGGEVQSNPKGREMGLARKIQLTAAGREHPMYDGKPSVFNAFISHEDHITKLPPDGVLLAGNDFTKVQALSVTHKKGTFWGVQYHPEYDLHEMARLIVAREQKLVAGGFFTGHDDLVQYVEKLETLFSHPERKDLRWQLDIDDDVLSDNIRQCEFANWIRKLVIPYIEKMT
ncbi:MAG: type 1 glutamine amidotransferase [Candidatus Omnitrophota bacterium]|jgi:GMP synthase (glutamine-hydrolysing)|nr:MAG: type 1 glutamine amidotransferase [Candidatus Omnitrophota bacterium]